MSSVSALFKDCRNLLALLWLEHFLRRLAPTYNHLIDQIIHKLVRAISIPTTTPTSQEYSNKKSTSFLFPICLVLVEVLEGEPRLVQLFHQRSPSQRRLSSLREVPAPQQLLQLVLNHQPSSKGKALACLDKWLRPPRESVLDKL